MFSISGHCYVRCFCNSKHLLKADCTNEILRLPWPKKTALWHIQPRRPWNTRVEKNTRFLPNTWGLDAHRHSKTGLRNLRGQLCMIQGFASNGFPGNVLYCIVCWFVGRSSGGCYSDCLHFLSVAAHIKGCVLVSIIVTNWILHFPRTHVTNLQCMCVLVCLWNHVCVQKGWKSHSEVCGCQRQLLISSQHGVVVCIHVCVRVCENSASWARTVPL